MTKVQKASRIEALLNTIKLCKEKINLLIKEALGTDELNFMVTRHDRSPIGRELTTLIVCSIPGGLEEARDIISKAAPKLVKLGIEVVRFNVDVYEPLDKSYPGDRRVNPHYLVLALTNLRGLRGLRAHHRGVDLPAARLLPSETKEKVTKMILNCLEHYESAIVVAGNTHKTFLQYVTIELNALGVVRRVKEKFGEHAWPEWVGDAMVGTGRYWRDGDAILPI